MYKTASGNAQRGLARASTRYSAPNKTTGVVKPLKKPAEKQFTTERDLRARKRAAKKSAAKWAKIMGKMTTN
jgi:hypothetical protein